MSQAPANPLKWIAAITAVITLVLGLNQVVRVFAEIGERQRQLAELQAVADRQREVGDFPAAWASLERALVAADQGSFLAKLSGRLDAPRLELRKAQEDLAMAWLRDVRVPEGKTFADVVDPLLAVITRGSIDADGVREADLLAHLGWAYFLKSRDGSADIDPARSYLQALDSDPQNPFAHGFWGHWIVWQRGSLEEAERHFAAALASGRERDVVRGLQMAALRNHTAPAVELALLRAVDEMRRNGEVVDAATRRYVFGIYFAALNADEYLRRVLGALPPEQHIETIRALYFDDAFDQSRVPLRDALIALLQEEAGDRDGALATWRAVQKMLGADSDGRVAELAKESIKRLTQILPSARARP
jgi:hypothetical protein